MTEAWTETIKNVRCRQEENVDLSAKAEAFKKLPRSAWKTVPNPENEIVAILVQKLNAQPFVAFMEQKSGANNPLVGRIVEGCIVLGWLEVGE